MSDERLNDDNQKELVDELRACLKIPKYDKINKKIGRDLNAQLSE